VESLLTRHADLLTAMKMLKDIILPSFGVPWYLMNDGDSHFKHRTFRKTLAKFGIDHIIASPIILKLVAKLS
jgi:hypothetical protein